VGKSTGAEVRVGFFHLLVDPDVLLVSWSAFEFESVALGLAGAPSGK
jgi:hypothetical protein